MRQTLGFPLLFLYLLPLQGLAGDETSSFSVGRGKADVTGPVMGQTMFGYGEIKQKTSGIHTRQWSRAFVIRQNQSGKMVALVNLDIHSISPALKEAVIKRLQEQVSKDFTEENVMLTATHTHSGAGGFSTSGYYNFSFMLKGVKGVGFNPRTFEETVDGIVQSIAEAHRSLDTAEISLQQGSLPDTSFKRSLSDCEFGKSADDRVVQLVFSDKTGALYGFMNWFAVHPTSLPGSNHLVSGDNKGVAENLSERELPGIVAAFVNSATGDASPHEDMTPASEKSQFSELNRTAQKQSEAAVDLAKKEGSAIEGELDYRHVWVEMDKLEVDGETLCDAAYGLPMAGGAEDGRTPFHGDIYEGITSDTKLKGKAKAAKFVGGLIYPGASKEHRACHGAKKLFASPGRKRGEKSLRYMPFQIVRVGQVVIVGAPAELTAKAGAALEKEILENMKGMGVTQVVISGLANSYSGYVATEEEYKRQHYEGASTLYGPKTLDGYKKVFGALATSMKNKTPAPRMAEKPKYLTKRMTIPLSMKINQVPRHIHKQEVAVSVDSTNGKRTVKAQTTYTIRNAFTPVQDRYFTIQRKEKGEWVDVAWDDDPETRLELKKKRLSRVEGEITWEVPASAPPGTYRMMVFQDQRKKNEIVEHQTTSSEFNIQ